MDKVYGNSRAYDLAFSYRDYASEVGRLAAWYSRLSESDGPRSVLELACGPARHAIEFARVGLFAAGLDIMPSMCAYASDLANECGQDVQIALADMTSFDLGARFDLVILMLNSLVHIPDEAALGRHFRCVRRHLAESGVYVIEAATGRPIEAYEEVEWTQALGDDRIDVRWGADGRYEYPSLRGVVGGDAVEIEDRYRARTWSVRELVRASEQAGLALLGGYGNFEADWVDELETSIELSDGGSLQHCLCFGSKAATGARAE